MVFAIFPTLVTIPVFMSGIAVVAVVVDIVSIVVVAVGVLLKQLLNDDVPREFASALPRFRRFLRLSC
jgi:hypothetical protein